MRAADQPAVAASSFVSQSSASSREAPHISELGCNPLQQAGRAGVSKILQRKSALKCVHGKPAGLRSVEIDGAIQQAPHPGRQFIA
jgi:hypothetical protein